MKYYQQGDVLLFVDEKPKSGKKVRAKNGRLILAEGEATGHAHAIKAGDGVSLMECDGSLFLSTEKRVTIKHEEHKAVTIPPGDYRIGKVREYDHFEEESKFVQD